MDDQFAHRSEPLRPDAIEAHPDGWVMTDPRVDAICADLAAEVAAAYRRARSRIAALESLSGWPVSG